MKRHEIINRVLNQFNTENIQYCLLRNEEWVYDKNKKPEADLDISITKNAQNKVEKILKSYNFRKKQSQFSKKHQGYVWHSNMEQQEIELDVQWGGVFWIDIPYLDDSIYKQRQKNKKLFTLSNEDKIVMYLFHSLFDKRFFKEKYKLEISKLLKTPLNHKYLLNQIKKVVKSDKTASKIYYHLKKKEFNKIINQKLFIFARFLFPKNIIKFLKISIRLIYSK